LVIQVPGIPQSGRMTVQVIGSCGQSGETKSDPVTVDAQPVTPEFLFFTHSADGNNPIAAVNAATGGYVGAPNLVAGVNFDGATPGDTVVLFMTGLGTTDPSYDAGVLPDSQAAVTATVSVFLGDLQLQPEDVVYAGVTPTGDVQLVPQGIIYPGVTLPVAGLYELKIHIPAEAPTGNVPVAVSLGGLSTPTGGFLTITQSSDEQ